LKYYFIDSFSLLAVSNVIIISFWCCCTVRNHWRQCHGQFYAMSDHQSHDQDSICRHYLDLDADKHGIHWNHLETSDQANDDSNSYNDDILCSCYRELQVKELHSCHSDLVEPSCRCRMAHN